MIAERDSMTLNESPWGSRSVATRPPAAEPERRRTRRSWPSRSGVQYRLRTLLEADRCNSPARLAACFAARGCTAHLATWRKARRKGSLRELASKKRGAKPAERNPLDAKVRVLEAKVARLEHELHTAHTILDVQGKVAGLLGLNLEHETRS